LSWRCKEHRGENDEEYEQQAFHQVDLGVFVRKQKLGTRAGNSERALLLSSRPMNNWKENLIEQTAAIQDLLRHTKTIAVLGIKPESHADQAAHYVPAHMAAAGYEVIPIPVYYPEVTEILGKRVFRKLTEIGRPIDMVNVFRRPADIPQHVDDILTAKPKIVWFQLGIRNDEAAQRLAEAGIKVVQDRCLMVEERQMAR
jgi:uncharacterized protein